MHYLLSAEEMSRLDSQASETYGVPAIVLMERAALESWRFISTLKPERLVVVAGKGNNGADGLALARIAAISASCQVAVVAAGCERAAADSLTALHLAGCRAIGVPVQSWSESPAQARAILDEADVLVDAMLGTGLAGPARSSFHDLFHVFGNARATGTRVVSLDVPGGVRDNATSPEPAVAADYTLTFGWAKQSLYTPWGRSCAGDIHVLDIGFPKQLSSLISETAPQLVGSDDLASFLNPLPTSAHKGTRGHVLVVAGSAGLTGAARLCAEAAVRSRAGLVTLLAETIPDGLSAAVMTRFAPDLKDGFAGVSRRIDAAVIGPGWGVDASRSATLAFLIERLPRGVIDADALAALKETPCELGDGWILTPHPAEAARLAGCDTNRVLTDTASVGRMLADRFACTVLLKAQTTHVCASDGRIMVVDGNVPALGCGGSGDVLSGVIGGIMAAGECAFDAAVAGVLAHAEAGRRLYRSRGWFVADDLPAEIARVLAGVPESAEGSSP